jgi:hypothetical protein
MGMVFAPSITVAMRQIRPAEAGSASGVLSTTRQVGSALGAAAAGAVLQNQLSTQLTSKAASAALQLPAAVRPGFLHGLEAGGNLEVGAGQAGHLALPPGVPAAVAAQIQALAIQVFDSAYVAAMLPAVMVGVAMVLIGAVSALFLERGWRRERASQARHEPAKSIAA